MDQATAAVEKIVCRLQFPGGWARPAMQGHRGDRAVRRRKEWEENTGKKPECGFHGKEQVRLCEPQ